MDNEPYLIKELEDYDSTFELTQDKQIPCSSKEQLKSKFKDKTIEFIGEYAKADLEDEKTKTLGIAVGKFESPQYSGKTFPIYGYKSHSRFGHKESGYVQCDGTENYIVLLKNVLPSRIVEMCAIVCLFFVSFFVGRNITFNTNSTTQNQQRLGSGGQNDFIENEKFFDDPSARMLVPVVKNIIIEDGQLITDFDNPQESEYSYKLLITLEDGKKIYESDIVPPGGKIDVPLSNDLSSVSTGTHENTTMAFKYYDDSQNELNTAHIRLPLVCK
ncbi:MAG: hypothetical protein LBH37_03160 [Oscillospiraceae bacterium]|jgi:hypothetical protein|nr:hypothetical protein [Oscillospiraceae bacterium]